MATEQAQMLSDFIDQIAVYTQIQQTDGSPRIVRRTNPTLVEDSTFTFVASAVEPHALVLPLNVVWIVFDSSRPDYRHVYRRDSKNPDTDNGFEHTWVRITQYDDLWEGQYYDPEDSGLSSNPEAQDNLIGVVRLSVASATPGDPVVITEGDPTLSNPRVPLPHDEMHPEVPATRLATTGRAVLINNGQPVEGGGMLSDFQGDSAWGGIPRTAIYPAVEPLSPAQAKLFPDMENTPVSADIVLVQEQRMNDNASHSSRDFDAELYGVSYENPIPLNTQKRIYMPVWSEDDANQFLFDGWYHPQSVTVLEGSATITPGPNATRTVNGTDYTTPSFFDVYFDTPGRVQLQVELASIGADSVTLRSTRDFFVEGSVNSNPSTPSTDNLTFYGITSSGILEGYEDFASLWSGTNPSSFGTSSFDASYSYFEDSGNLYAVAPNGTLFEATSFDRLWSGSVNNLGVVSSFVDANVFSFSGKIYVISSSDVLTSYDSLADAISGSNPTDLGISSIGVTRDFQFITGDSLVRLLIPSNEIIAYTSVEAAWNMDNAGYDSELSVSSQGWTQSNTKIIGYSNSSTGGN